jgi:hypothetical protein
MRLIVRKIGWPNRSKVGTRASHAAWLLVQHADHDVMFQDICLRLMRQFKPPEIDLSDMAYLEDRIQVNKDLPQVFGTQFRQVEGKHVPLPIEEPDLVNERRALVGLNTFEENLDRMYQKYPF